MIFYYTILITYTLICDNISKKINYFIEKIFQYYL